MYVCMYVCMYVVSIEYIPRSANPQHEIGCCLGNQRYVERLAEEVIYDHPPLGSDSCLNLVYL